MIKETLKKEEKLEDTVEFKEMVMLALATSIDALAMGISFAFLDVNIILSAGIIGITTLIISIIGVIIGNKFGDRFEKKAKVFGGVILILIGIKILIEHLV